MASQVNSDIPPSSASVVMLSAPNTQDNTHDAFQTPPEQASLDSSDVNVVPHSAGSQVLVDPSDISMFLDEIDKFALECSEEFPMEKLELEFAEDLLYNDSCREILMHKNPVPGENVGGKKSSYEIGEVSDLRCVPVLDLLPDSIRCHFEKGAASGLYEGIESFTMFDVLKAIKKSSDKTLLETAKRAGFTFPRPSYWPEDMKSELFIFDDEEQTK